MATADRNTPQAQARYDDLAWMARHGETVAGAAVRLGITEKNLDHWCGTHAATHLFAQLRANEHARGGIPTGRLIGAA